MKKLVTKKFVKRGVALGLAFGILGAAPLARAELSSSVKVRVRNSSNYVYPCNAGVALNPRSQARGVDYVRGYWVASEHNPRAAAGQGVAVGGARDSGFADPDFGALSSLLGGGRAYPSYNQLLPEATMYDFVVGRGASGDDRFEINLASDTYDAAYFVTFCFKPSLVANPEDPVQSELKFASARVTHSVVTGSASNYATDSGLKAMIEVKCVKNQGRIVQYYTPGGVTEINALLAPFGGATTVELAPSGGILIGDGPSLVSGSPLETGELPDECRIRFHFIETSGALRPHVMSSSDIQIDLDATVGRLGG
ncbi:MAG: hypothetical protein NDJ89_04610 [Oligoflexia bacterium]|nr:hypothetical protein [Oligoflexia bacterium]